MTAQELLPSVWTIGVVSYQERLNWAIAQAGYDYRGGQEKLAREIGIKSATLGQVRRGESNEMTASNSARTAKILGVDHFWLATGEGEPIIPKMDERLALSAQAVYIGERLDAIVDPAQRARAYALIVQVLDFGFGQTLPPDAEPN